jgi:hypothetical protein
MMSLYSRDQMREDETIDSFNAECGLVGICHVISQDIYEQLTI